ncbi:MAG: hypothetical protein JKY25_05325 [Robiginitomaculum sp.]|nr:hypothetical protein [Robiginitomaculum sp.]
MSIWFLAAAVLSFSVCLVHVFLGGKEAARPLLDSSDLKPVEKYTNYYCWHMVTIIIAALGVMFSVAAFIPSAQELAWAASVLAALFCGWNIGLYFWKRQELRRWYHMPQWVLFLPIAVLGAVGLLV